MGKLSRRRFVLGTVDPNQRMTPIHTRMPVIPRPDDEAPWLKPDESAVDRLSALRWCYRGGETTAWPVVKAVNNPQHDGADLVQPLPTVPPAP